MASARPAPITAIPPRPFLESPAFAVLLIAVATSLAYHNTFAVPFVFDDRYSILANTTIRSLREAWWPPAMGGFTVSGRPVLNVSLALNYAVSGLEVWSYHALNLAIHIAGGVTLFGIVRRTLLRPVLAPRFGPDAFPIALLAATLWALHPLQTEAVTYVIQRAESLMGLFYLLTLWCFIRSVEEHGAWSWKFFAVAACAVGAATKEDMVSAPVIVLLYDRTFVTGSFREAWRQHRGLLLSLAATWLILAVLVASTGGNRGGTFDFGPGLFWAHLLTQFGAITHYLQLAVWPHPLVFEYGVEWVKNITDILPYVFVVTALVAGTVVALWRWPVLGFLGCWFFAFLAPTSLLPATIQTIVEYRVYLSLAALTTLAAAGAWAAGGRRAVWLTLAIVAPALLVVTELRNRDYRTEVNLWQDTLAKRPRHGRAMALLAEAYRREGQLALARHWLEQSLAVQPGVPDVLNNLGDVCQEMGDLNQAVACFQQALALRPGDRVALNNLGNALILSGRAPEGIAQLQAALRAAPDSPTTRANLANALAQAGRMPEAAAEFEALLQAHPDDADAHDRYSNVLLSLGRGAEALAQIETAVQLQPDSAELHNRLGVALARSGRMREALAQFQDALRLNPAHASARQNALRAQQMLGN